MERERLERIQKLFQGEVAKDLPDTPQKLIDNFEKIAEKWQEIRGEMILLIESKGHSVERFYWTYATYEVDSEMPILLFAPFLNIRLTDTITVAEAFDLSAETSKLIYDRTNVEAACLLIGKE